MTALVILSSGVTVNYGMDSGMTLTAQAFSAIYGDWVCIPLSLALCCFALATILGWGMYGARCAQYLFGEGVWKPFVWMQVTTVILGAALNTGTVWMLSETVNGLMAIPNLIALAWLSPVVADITKKYKKGKLTAYGGTNENLDQRKQMRTFSHAEISPLCCKSKEGHNSGI